MSNLSNDTFYGEEPPQASNCSQQRGVKDHTAVARLKYEMFKRYKKIMGVLEEFLQEEEGDEEMKGKIESMISDFSTSKMARFCTKECDKSLLGIEDKQSEKLFEFEVDKFLGMLERQKETGSSSTLEETPPPSIPPLDVKDHCALDHKNKLLAEQKLYIQNLVTLKDILDELTDQRLKQAPSAPEQNIEHHQNEVKLDYSKSHTSLRKIQTDIFEETDVSSEAYKEQFKGVRTQTEDCEKDIQDLMDLKLKCEDVACRQYDDILNQYINIKDYIKNKKLI